MENCLFVQSDYTIHLEVAHPSYSDARDFLMRFSELVKCPEHLHTYQLTDISIWNAASLGITFEQTIAGFNRFSKFPLPSNVISLLKDKFSIYGKIKLISENGEYFLEIEDQELAKFIFNHSEIQQFFEDYENDSDSRRKVIKVDRGRIKLALIKIGYPIDDIAGYVDGLPLTFEMETKFTLRDYQVEAADTFYSHRGIDSGSGVLVLPCGAGKTVIGMELMKRLNRKTLILCANTSALRQWKSELIAKTNVPESEIAEYSGATKDVKQITLATYQILISRSKSAKEFSHLALFEREDWGLIIYDEVHLLPAPIFQVTATIQARRRLGLTATLVREDHKESDVFCLIGGKKYDVPWRVLEQQGWIATVNCCEVRIEMPAGLRDDYSLSPTKERFRLASCNPLKLSVIEHLLSKHQGHQTLIIGMYLDQIKIVAQHFDLPIIDGKIPQKKRDELYAKFRTGEIQALVLSKVGNFSIDLPDASVAIQISGMYGSRQEEAQRLGRILRPKKTGEQAFFYTLVTKFSEESRFALNRQLFLVEQGYEYHIAEVSPPKSQSNLPLQENAI